MKNLCIKLTLIVVGMLAFAGCQSEGQTHYDELMEDGMYWNAMLYASTTYGEKNWPVDNGFSRDGNKYAVEAARAYLQLLIKEEVKDSLEKISMSSPSAIYIATCSEYLIDSFSPEAKLQIANDYYDYLVSRKRWQEAAIVANNSGMDRDKKVLPLVMKLFNDPERSYESRLSISVAFSLDYERMIVPLALEAFNDEETNDEDKFTLGEKYNLPMNLRVPVAERRCEYFQTETSIYSNWTVLSLHDKYKVCADAVRHTATSLVVLYAMEGNIGGLLKLMAKHDIPYEAVREDLLGSVKDIGIANIVRIETAMKTKK
ncbi:hypothetical protein HQ571_01025 [Candidatus Kuenenbacteria bacterium]|nr:hypothetical protein [Candidatus Kuenenbacteria bacterium]